MDSTPEPKNDGWRTANLKRSLESVNATVPVPREFGFWRKLLAFSGPGFLVAVGYMDPGNWATDLSGGSRFGYTLLSVVFISNLIAILLQALAAKLGIVSGRDLAQACRDHYSKPVVVVLWILCELAIAACDLAEVIGSAIALNLLFHLPLVMGVCITAFDVFLVMYLQNKGFRYLETLVVGVITVIALCFAVEILLSHPNMTQMFLGFIPTPDLVRNPEMLYLAIGILGATVMPHNLYLHSSIVQTRKYEQTADGKREAIRFAFIDSTIALSFAFLVNAAIVVLAAATFHTRGQGVDDLREAFHLLQPALGVTAGIVFAIALLASGQNSTLTGTLAGQIVMEGFLDLRMRPAARRILTRAVALVPAIIVTGLAARGGEVEQFNAAGKLLVLSQVILSLQLGFAVIPLVRFTNDPQKMGPHVNGKATKVLAWIAAAAIVLLNIKFAADFIGLSQWIAKKWG